jgi:type I restriction enzyme M protein
MTKKNQFCEFDDLSNEADVEQIFVRRLIEFLGYQDNQIRPKDSLTKLIVGGMRGKTAIYKPDFAMKLNDKVRWIFEAKSPAENLGDHIWQPRGYCDLLNGQYKSENPIRYFVLSNGIKTRLYQWDVTDPLLELDFDDFTSGNKRFSQLIDFLSPRSFANSKSKIQETLHRLEKRPLEDVNSAFAWCHQHIYKKDNISQAAAFTEFVKVVFLKLLSDRHIRDKYPNILAEEVIDIPIDDVMFSMHWIEEQEKQTPNPLDTIRFHDFIESMEREIQKGKRKRIFSVDERINLSPETIRGVVGKIEHIFLFGIDVDLNGRLFETFLNATMRGKDLGQFFTPRSIIELGVKLARLRVHVPLDNGSYYTDVVLDGCCGTGGFLIDALTDMWNKVNRNSSLDDNEKEKLRKRIANNQVFGIDIGREPPLARIARLNMYLHGDGGSSIYQIDTLDKDIRDKEADSPEIAMEKSQLRQIFKPEGFADVVLTNPPFAKAYERSIQSEAQVLDKYAIGIKPGGEKRLSLKSSLMFIERYHDLLKIGGKLITVIDDGILSGDKYNEFRSYIRDHFIVKAIISLPGDAFQRSKARVKTSLLIAEKRDPNIEQRQPPVFMYACEYVGIDDSARQRTLPIDRINREAAIKEIQDTEEQFTAFLEGKGASKYIVQPEKITDRLDVKSCLLVSGRMAKTWTKQGIGILTLEDLAELKTFNEDDIIDTKETDDFVTALIVRYEGFAESGDEFIASETNYPYLYRVHSGDIVISNIAANYGSIAVVSKELDGCVVSSEYTVLTAKKEIDPIVVWLLLRSPEARAEMLLRATGISRNRIKWETIKTMKFPKPDDSIIENVTNLTKLAEKAEHQAEQHRNDAREAIEMPLQLSNEEALRILRAFKPPR